MSIETDKVECKHSEQSFPFGYVCPEPGMVRITQCDDCGEILQEKIGEVLWKAKHYD